jgi:hypothetical protein
MNVRNVIINLDSSVGIATRLRNGRHRNLGSIPSRGKSFFLLRNIQTGDDPVPYTMVTTAVFPESKAAGA